MKNIAKISMLSAAAAMLFTACVREDFGSSDVKGLDFKATIGEATRTELQLGETSANVNWVLNDEVVINGVTYVANPDPADPTHADLTKKSEGDADPALVNGKYYASYGFTYTTSTGKGNLAYKQTYNAASLAGVSPMFAVSEDNNLSFKNICGLLKINLKGDKAIKSIQVSSTNLAMCGDFTIADGQTAVIDAGVHVAKSPVTLVCPEEGVALTAGGVDFYVAVPAGEYEGLTIKAFTTDGMAWEAKSAVKAAVVASKLYSLAFTPEFKQYAAAQVGDVTYATLQAAFEAANASDADCTIKLLDNSAVNAGLFVKNAQGKKITLDLNGYTINCCAASTTGISISSDCDIIGNGTVISGFRALCCNTNNVKVDIKGGKYIGYDIYGAIRHYGLNAVMTFDGDVEVINASDKAGYYALNNGMSESTSAGFVVIKGGKFISNNGTAIRCAYGDITVEGGIFIGKESAAVTRDSEAIINVKGGYFYAQTDDVFSGNGLTGLVEACKVNKEVGGGYLSTGKACVALDPAETVDGYTFTIEVKESEVPVYTASVITAAGTTGYESIDEAFVAAEDESECTVKLLRSCTLSDGPTFVQDKITLDLNGYILETPTSMSVDAGSLYIVDSSESQEGKVLNITSSQPTFIVQGGEVNVLSGFVTHKDGNLVASQAFVISAAMNDATLNIKGGRVKAVRCIQINSTGGNAATVNVSGGLVEGNANKSDNSPIFISTEGTLNVSGGTIKAKQSTSGVNAAIHCTNDAARVYIYAGTDENGKETIPCLMGGNASGGNVLSQKSGLGGEIFQTQTTDGKPIKFYSNLTTYKNLPASFKAPEACTEYTDAWGNKFTYLKNGN